MPLLSSPWLYAIVLVAVAIDGFVPIVPSETLVIGLGALSATGRPNLVALAAAVTAGGVAGDHVSYALGRRAGARPARNPRLALARRKAEQALSRHGGTALGLLLATAYGIVEKARSAQTASGSIARKALVSRASSGCSGGHRVPSSEATGRTPKAALVMKAAS
jgi:membrane-associated protein